MKLAFSTLACPGWSVDQVVAAAVRWGYAAVEWRLLDGELIDPRGDREQLGRAVAACRAAGLDVCALDTSCRFNLPDPAARARQVADLRAWIGLAGDLAVPVLRVFGGALPPGATAAEEESNGWVAESLAVVASQAAAAGVVVALETHDAFAAARRVAAVLDRVASPAVGALWDLNHPFRAGESAAEVLRALGARLALVHIKDTQPGATGATQVLLGAGDVPVGECLHALRVAGYAGYCSVEWEKKWQPAIPEPEIALPQHGTWLRSALPWEASDRP